MKPKCFSKLVRKRKSFGSVWNMHALYLSSRENDILIGKLE